MTAPTSEAVKAEIEALKQIKPKVRPESFFGDNHHDAIDAQVKVLTEDMSEEDAESEFEYEPDNVRNAAMEAYDWLEGSLPEAPSAGWQELVV